MLLGHGSTLFPSQLARTPKKKTPLLSNKETALRPPQYENRGHLAVKALSQEVLNGWMIPRSEQFSTYHPRSHATVLAPRLAIPTVFLILCTSLILISKFPHSVPLDSLSMEKQIL